MYTSNHKTNPGSGVRTIGKNILTHERLAIVGVDSGAQPLTTLDGNLTLSVNGEIYNHITLRSLLKNPHQFQTKSDCEVILYLYEEFGDACVAMLDGMFSFVLYDERRDRFLVARDHVGITTLYQGWRASDNSFWFASEMKALNAHCDRIISFPPGNYYCSDTHKHTEYYRPRWFEHPKLMYPSNDVEGVIQTEKEDAEMYKNVKIALENSVKKRLMTEVPYGVLLSGGLDSSLIAAIAMRVRKQTMDDEDSKCITIFNG